MFTFDHFDGATAWGYPEDDMASALTRLSRLKGRPALVASNDISRESFLEDHGDMAALTLLEVPVADIFSIPGDIEDAHTDLWMHRDSVYRQQVRDWMRKVVTERSMLGGCASDAPA